MSRWVMVCDGSGSGEFGRGLLLVLLLLIWLESRLF